MATATNQPAQSSKQPNPNTAPSVNSRPNESGVVSVQGHVKIHDPNSNKVFVEGRA